MPRLKTSSRLAIVFLLATSLWACQAPSSDNTQPAEVQTAVNELLDQWHQAASQADFNGYFDMMTDEAIFLGTEATENWNKTEFMAYAKPHFDRGNAWSFTAFQRNIYLQADHKTAWFDELLQTSMGICRGSGVAVLETDSGRWKVAHYVLSVDIPNEKIRETITLKKEWDSLFLKNNSTL